MQSSPQRASVPFANEAPNRADLTPVVASFSGVAAPAVAPPEQLDSLERYKLLARLGQGGMAEVYLAAWEVAPFVHRPVVVKRLHPHFNEDPRLVQMFLDEARLITQLDHPHIVKTLEAGVIDGRCCIAMEYLEGQPLQRVLRRANERGGLAPHIAVSIAISVLDGLHYSHETKDAEGQPLEIVHRDVSPQNVFVSNDGQVKVLDFGIAKANSQEGRTATGIVKGKVGYIAPEQARAENVDRRADIWSVGVLLWESLTGARLFKAETDAATLGLTLQGQIPSAGSRRVGVPEELEGVLMRALQRDPALRYQTAGAMRKDLEGWLARAGFSRDARVIAGLMKDLFTTEIIEQKRLVSVLMARSDCTPPAPPSNRSPSSTSALYLKVPQTSGATSAELTRMHDQMEELGKRHRRAFRGMFALVGALLLITCVAVFLNVSRGSASAAHPVPTANLAAALPAPKAQPAAAPAPIGAVEAHAAQAPSAAAVSAALQGEPSPLKTARPTVQQLRPAAAPALALAAKPSSAAAPAPEQSASTVASAPKPEATASFGFLTIDTSPWSVVSVGGRVLGQTPVIGARLPSGTQVLTLKNPELGIETSYPIMIENGKTTVRRIGIE
ncbi:MAG TPA: serine/threonine-protein kinase [Polyangiaceae bacterium]|nr:serine/threonine-protein kinase [Polyangiaceae bacterium]